jgi:DNA polymerase family B
LEFAKAYTEQLFKQVKLTMPDVPDDVIFQALETVVKKEMRDREIVFATEETKERKSMIELLNWLETEKPIITGYGTFYKRHVESVNHLSKLIGGLLSSRKVAKKEMFKYVNTDRNKYENLDLAQKTYKLLANSFYGATVEKNSTFYNKFFGPSITYNGVVIITTAVNAFETFMSNNIYFKNLNDVLYYISNILDQEYKNLEAVTKDITKEMLLEYLTDKLENKSEEDLTILNNIVQEMDQTTVNKVYYKNNIYEFLDNSKTFGILPHVIDTSFLDPNEPPETLLSDMGDIWELMEEWVFYNHAAFYRYHNAENRKRKTVLMVDTDSNFLMLDPFYKYFLKNFPDQVDSSNESKVSVVNIATYILAKVIEKTYWKMTTDMNVPEDKREIINMKNEYFYERLMTTRNKKNYAGLLIMQEGHMFEKPKIDVKGLAIRKVNVNQNVRAYFNELLEDRILKSEKISMGEIFGTFNRLQEDIKQSLLKGEIKYTIPIKVNEIESYKFPFRMQQVRGAIAWNNLYPKQELALPTKANYVKLTAKTLKDMAGKIPMEQYKVIKETIFDANEDLAKHGFSILCLPKDLEEIPEWVVPLLDIETMTKDHVKSGIILLESLGFKTLDILTDQFPTNVIDF